MEAIMMRVLRFVLAGILVMALIVVILPRVTSKETCSYDEAVKKYAPGKFVTVGGKRVHYVEKGDGKPVILLHGFLYHTVAWKQNLDALANKSKTYAIDLFGWGYSERLKTMDYSFPFYAKQVVGFMDALNIKKASLIGHSLGGGIAIYVAAHYPERVDKLVLIDPGALPIPMPTIGWIFQRPFVGEFLNAIPGNALWENNIKTVWYYDDKKVTKEYVNEVLKPLCIKGSYEGLMYILRNVVKSPYVENEVKMLAKRNKPILIFQGREDKAVPLDRSELLNKMWKDSKLVVFYKSGHNPHEEHPNRFNKLAVEFLSQ
jgi:pimeloyl-ACP methyl ester carboxylesterase